MIEPIQFDFIVRCPAVEAFDTWTKDISIWWPSQHTRSRERGTTIVIEPDIGGRIYERTPAGEEFHWGSVIAWDRPERFAYRWHITTAPDEATDVEVRFADAGDGSTRVTISHTGFDRLGERGPPRRSANLRHWQTLIPEFVRACETTEAGRP